MALAETISRTVPPFVRRRAFRRANRRVVGATGLSEYEPEFVEAYRRCEPFTMTSPERMYATWRAVKNITANGISGDIVECGVWRGGQSMLAALTLGRESDRTIWLYDTFTGMSEPTPEDGPEARDLWQKAEQLDRPEWCYAALEDVKHNMQTTGYPNVRYVEGKVEDTIPAQLPERIALLRLDTDWYDSTRHELEHLYPLLSPGGVVILDDYGFWEGSSKAADEYFAQLDQRPLLNRTDGAGYIGVKIH